jgi:hypothetical protein
VLKAVEFIRNFWITVQLKAPPLVRQQIIPRLHETKEITRLLVRPNLPMYQLQGQGQGGPLEVTYVGLEYAKPVLKSLLFVEEPLECQVGQIPFWHLSKLAGLSSSEIVIVAAYKHLISSLPHQNAIILPEFVRHVLDIRGNWEEVKSRFRKSVRYEMRLTRKYNYEYEISCDDRDFEMFYHDMYLPTMNSRHGTLSLPTPFQEAYQYFRHGFLFLVKRDGQQVCGSVCYAEQDVLHFLVLGVLNADERLLKEGALGALNTLRLQWANQQGYKAANFLGSNPYMKSGMFQYKRKWGTSVHIPTHLHRWIWLKVNRNTPAVSIFLKENPFIVVDEKCELYGLIVVDDLKDATAEMKQEWEKRYATPGLKSLLVRPKSSFTEKLAKVNDLDLIIPLSFSTSLENN